MKKKFKDLMIGQSFKTEFLFDDCLITGIKKSTRTALMCLDNDRKNDFIMYITLIMFGLLKHLINSKILEDYIYQI